MDLRSPLPRTGPASEPPAWEAIYDDLGEKVFRLLHRMTGSPELAEDLTHDTFVRAFERMAQFDGRGPLGAWVLRIAANLARDHWKRPRMVRSVGDDGLPESGRAPEIELRLALRAALDGIPETHRLVFLLYEVDGFTHEEIAATLEIAVGTSKARLSRGRAMLRERLGRDR